MHIMFSSDRFLLVVQLILLKLLGLLCVAEEFFPRINHHHQHHHMRMTSVSASIDDYFTVLNCSTPKQVPHHKLDWYFQTRSSSHPPRVIWQRGRSNTHRYLAYSPDQLRHFLQIKPLHFNDSGTYMCLDQTSGYSTRVELSIHDSRSCAGTIVTFDGFKLISLIFLSLVLSKMRTR